jgi:hypothetical protein
VNLGENQAVVVQAPRTGSPSTMTQYWIRCLPHDFPVLQVNHAGNPNSGWYLTGNIIGATDHSDGYYAMILDGNGTPVWYKNTPDKAVDTELFQPNVLAWIPAVFNDPNEAFTLYNLSTQTYSTIAAPTPPTDLHELIQLADGSRVIISSPERTGVDLSSLGSPFNTTTNVIDCLVQRFDQWGNILWRWSEFDHNNLSEVQTYLSSINPYGNGLAADIFHCNSIDFDSATGNVLVSSRHEDAVYLISGAPDAHMIWKLGGTPSTKDATAQILTIQGDSLNGMSGQHDARFEPNGDISVYDDRSKVSGAARAVQYHIDTTAGTATLDFQYSAPDGQNSAATGSFRRYNNGNDNLVGWGIKAGSALTEFDASGKVLFDLSFPKGDMEYRVVKVDRSAIDANLLRMDAGVRTGGQYHPLASVRILDTRNRTGGVPAAPIGPGGSLSIRVAGAGGVPSTASAAVINVTITNTTAASYLTVYPTGVSQPLASDLNWVPGETVTNLVEVPLGVAGAVTIYNGAGSVDVLFDVAGYVSPAPASGSDGLYNPLVPVRILDTRNGTGVPMGPLGAGQTLNLQTTGQGAVPPSGVSAVVLNVTVTNATAPSYLTVFPTGTDPPPTSNLNFVAGQTVPNRVIVGIGAGGQVSFLNFQGSVDVIADVGGWFTDSSNPSAIGGTFVGVTPARILDTRNGIGLVNGLNGVGPVPTTPFGPGEGTMIQVAGQGGIPAMTDPNPPTAVVANVTITHPTVSGYLTAWPDGSTRPLASDLNWAAGLTVPNLVVVKLGSSGMADLFTAAGCVDAIVDVVGYYTGPLPTESSPLAPTPSCGVNGNPWGYNFSCCKLFTSPTSNFCSYFACTPNFQTGNGYVVECLDAKYSKSGGAQGACSNNGGVWRPLYAP